MQVVKAPNTILRSKTKPIKKITPRLSNTIQEMIKLTLSFKDPEGVGLAANQAGLNECYFVAKIGTDPKVTGKNQFRVFINPKILSSSKKTKQYFEGCLSIPNMWGETIRSLSVKVSYQDLAGQIHNETLKGVDAWIFQHEVDHLDGILFPDRVLEQGGRFYKYTGKDSAGQDMFEEVTL